MSLIISLILCTTIRVDAMIVKLRPDVSEKNKTTISSVITDRAAKYGWSSSDYGLILAMAKKESNFTHMKGTHGEIGFLQVIPEDGHIMEIVSGIVCNDKEKYCSNGRPDVKSDGVLASWKVRRFLELHPQYAFETGLGEMQYWKQEYEDKLKSRYWTKFPEWYLRKSLTDFEKRHASLRWWWNNLVSKAGDYVWISHYNWGNRMSTATASRNYALQVVSILNTI